MTTTKTGMACLSLLDLGAISTKWIKKYFTCDGRFVMLYGYHFCFINHVRHDQLLNVPYFLYQTLLVMISKVREAKSPDNNISHHGLIKILVMNSLQAKGESWD